MPNVTVIRNARTVVAYDEGTGGHAYMQDVDVAVRHAVSFAVMADALTT